MFSEKWAIVLCALYLLISGSATASEIEAEDSACPHRCMCFKTTVRCMFVQMEIIPDIPVETTILDLRFNKVKELLTNTFKYLPKLETLLLNNNYIAKIEKNAFAGLPELRYLYIYKNRIKSIDKDAFNGLHKLEQLYIHFNKIDQIDPETFDDLPSLERLFLHNNHLSRIPQGSFRKLSSLRRLRLDSNALICDCEMVWFIEMMKVKGDATQVAATCEYPASLQGKPLRTLSAKDFQCKHPKLTEEPKDVDVSLGETAYFSCKADGEPKPEIIWLHNSNEILPEPDGRYNVLTDGTLMITEAKDLDEGVYECMAKNPAGEIKSRAAKMHYLNYKGQLAFLERPTDQNVTLGSTITLPCGVTGHPPPQIGWTFNNTIIPTAPRYYISSVGTLSIKAVQTSDSGTYQCAAVNEESEISASVKVVVHSPPTFLERPRDQIAIEGHNVKLICRVEAYPQAKLFWTREGQPIRTAGRIRHNGTVFSIRNVQKSDQGVYACHAENVAGQRNSSALLMVREKESPVFTTVPEDKTVAPGSSVELPCHAQGQPMPSIRWRKDGHDLSSDDTRHRISPHGVLYMFNMWKGDEGIYECIAENDVGQSSISIQLLVGDGGSATSRRYPGNRFVVSALGEARTEVEQAMNKTLSNLFEQPHQRSPAKLMQIFRFPSDEALKSARAAEIYERAMEIVWEHVQNGAQFNLSEFSYENMLSPSHLELMANLSGCLVHNKEVSCSDMCFHKQYRTLDGTCNNFNNPTWGSSLTPFVRLLPPEYENGFNTAIGWSRTHLYNGHHKPSARLVSTTVVSADSVSKDSQVSHMLMQWGQFLDHDLDFSMPAVSHASYIDGVDCATSCNYTPPCFPIEVPPRDPRIQRHRCMEFVRSSTACGSGLTSVFFNQIQPREQINQLTAFLDASNVYGSNDRLARHIRNFTTDRGLLRQGLLMSSGKPLLPFNDGQPIDCKRDLSQSSIDCFLAGDVRANEQLGLLAMHTLWFREHNRIANELHKHNSHWSGDKLYNEARKISGAEMQHITYSHWLPKIIGDIGMNMLGPYSGYNPAVNPSVANSFATAALRFGHTLINPELMRLNETFQPIQQGHIPLQKAFFAPFRLVEEGGIDPLMRGLIFASAKLKRADELLNSDLTEHLFTPAHLVAQDLAALNIQRGRDHGLPSYNTWRKFCNLTVAKTFSDFSAEITDGTLLRKLERLYGHPDNIDLWVGGIAEDTVDGAKVGPTFRCLLVDQFKRLRAGDRFWYKNPGVFTPEQLSQIEMSSLSRVICDNGDNVTTLTPDAFLVPVAQQPQFVQCSSLPKVKLDIWTECCQECSATPRESVLLSRSKRSSFSADDARIRNQSSSDILYRQEVDFDAMEERIEGIEELVGRLEQTVKKLTRKVRRLEANNKHNGYCHDELGRVRKSNEVWKADKCTSCKCQNTHVICHVDQCPPLKCSHPTTTIEGECCPICT